MRTLLIKTVTVNCETVTCTLYRSGWWEATWLDDGHLSRLKCDDWDDLIDTLESIV